MDAKFERIQPGLYRSGKIEICDQYTYGRIAQSGRRWVITKAGKEISREFTLTAAKKYAAKHIST